MKKTTRFVILLAVLAICFAFLWPSISWYWRTPKEVQVLALGSLENIKDYATVKANEDFNAVIKAYNTDPSAKIDAKYAWLEKAAAKNYKKMGEKVPSPMTVKDILDSYKMSKGVQLRDDFTALYRDEILAAKKNYQNSVKLGLDLSGGMNIIVKADLDAAAASQTESNVIADIEQFKKDAMANAIENLSSRIDRFGLTEPVIRQQGEDRIYIEMPGAAEADSINTIIMGKGILNFRLVDNDATEKFSAYYTQHIANTFNSAGELIDPSIIPADCEIMGQYTKDDYGLDERIGYLVVK